MESRLISSEDTCCVVVNWRAAAETAHDRIAEDGGEAGLAPAGMVPEPMEAEKCFHAGEYTRTPRGFQPVSTRSAASIPAVLASRTDFA